MKILYKDKILVVNKHKHQSTPNDVYIGRGSILGNPFTGSKNIKQTKALYQCSSREEAVEKYREYLLEKIKNKDKAICNELNRLYKKIKDGETIYLVCFCKPKKCHGDVVRDVLLSKL